MNFPPDSPEEGEFTTREMDDPRSELDDCSVEFENGIYLLIDETRQSNQ